MANEEHLRILKQGVEVWNAWREQNPHVRPDFREADLTGADLTGVDLSGANLIGANLIDANLSGADLIGANLIDANLSGADLIGADLSEADISEADLIDANLSHAGLTGADLAGVDLSGADLEGANLTRAHLSGAELSNCIVWNTVFGNVDLSRANGLATVKHFGPSIIDIDTIYRSGGNIPEVFLRGAGVPENFIQYMRSLVGKGYEYYSCFISFSHHDQRFCKRLHADLQARGVRVWFFPENARTGEPVWGEIDRGIRVYDKLVVVCSKDSLNSPPVLDEIERAVQREHKEGKQVLFPIRIDNYVLSAKWQHYMKAKVTAKVIGDFRGWDKDVDKYEASLQRLMRDLHSETDAVLPQ